jgi:hypothetical protein
VEAEASLVLSQAYVLESRIRLAHRFSSRARKLFVRHSDAAGQAEALAIESYSASALGMDAEAVHAANEGIALRARIDSPGAQVLGLNYLGVASFWAKDFGTACGVLDDSVSIANCDSSGASASFRPLVNLCFTEMLRVVQIESDGQRPADLSALQDYIFRTKTVAEKVGQDALTPYDSAIGLLLLELCACFLLSRSGRLNEADSCFMACFDRASRLPRTSWLHAIVWWARLEREKAYGDVDTAIVSAQAMAEYAKHGEHIKLQALANSLEATLRTQYCQ